MKCYILYKRVWGDFDIAQNEAVEVSLDESYIEAEKRFRNNNLTKEQRDAEESYFTGWAKFIR